MNITTRPTTAIAYTRVSSEKQRKSGQSLAEQRLAIETYAHHSHLRIVDWFEDVASAGGARSISRRAGFQAAVDKAEKLGVPIVVASFDRLSRDLKSFVDFVRHRNLVFLSAEEGSYLTPANLEARIARAEANNMRRSQSAKDEYAQRRALGLSARNPDLDGARKKSADVRSAKAQAKADHLANILRSDPSLADLSLQKLSDRLNELGHHDLEGRAWTKASVHSALTRLKQAPEGETPEPALSDQDTAELEKNPLFGMF
ncbi:recombinase family protein [Ruixingdingia sedimenti]|uniref:Recombinase family protein n=1 Tax=Ruixingdingia sedimenti TaxID=3073604 RepID=A0ABU1FF30_9RHOB|nr:recombinase family protein [Xinfangfangia sp. LG-4]MDR5655501.1 recombinase family protein [Xinfangfangia sp. LG-4]